jgi:beta-glucosidase
MSNNSFKFPKNFLWGAATASHQIEGNNYNQWTVWEFENAKTKSVQAEYQYGDWESWDYIKNEAKNPDNYVSGDLMDHYNNFERDFEFIKKMHMNAFRFSVEWSRIEPKDGEFDTKEIEHYKKYATKLKEMNIEPILTLFHFTLPIWFVEKGRL